MPTHTRQRWPEGRHVAILNRRDPEHPDAGGAEVYCRAVARWLTSQGATVTLVTSRAPGQARASVVDGVTVNRGGGRFGVYLYVLAWLLSRRRMGPRRGRGQIDAVLDCQNGIPFFSPLVVGRRVPVALLIHHVHHDEFALRWGTRLAGVGRFLEGRASRYVYRSRPVLTVSPSTRYEIRRHLGFSHPIDVVPNGAPRPRLEPRTLSAHPTVVSVGRLVAEKHVDELLVAVAEARREVRDLVLHIVGDGPELGHLQRRVGELSLTDAVVFHGRVDDAERDAILRRSWLFLSASQRAGSDIAVLEAAAHGLPALVRDVPGLRGAVSTGSDGWLLADGRVFSESLAAALTELTADGAMEALAEECRGWARGFSWARSARRVSEILARESARFNGESPVPHAPGRAIASRRRRCVPAEPASSRAGGFARRSARASTRRPDPSMTTFTVTTRASRASLRRSPRQADC